MRNITVAGGLEERISSAERHCTKAKHRYTQSRSTKLAMFHRFLPNRRIREGPSETDRGPSTAQEFKVQVVEGLGVFELWPVATPIHHCEPRAANHRGNPLPF